MTKNEFIELLNAEAARLQKTAEYYLFNRQPRLSELAFFQHNVFVQAFERLKSLTVPEMKETLTCLILDSHEEYSFKRDEGFISLAEFDLLKNCALCNMLQTLEGVKIHDNN